MAKEIICCNIEHHAMLFAFLAKHAITLCGEAGKEAILAGMTTYGNERGGLTNVSLRTILSLRIRKRYHQNILHFF